jgi:hypothetical protein
MFLCDPSLQFKHQAGRAGQRKEHQKLMRHFQLAIATCMVIGIAGILSSQDATRSPSAPAKKTVRHATTHKLAHKATACAISLDACLPEGCGGGDPSLNKKKNVLEMPTGQPEEFTFQDFAHLEDERPGPGDYTQGDMCVGVFSPL